MLAQTMAAYCLEVHVWMELAVLQLLEPWDNAWGLIDDARDWEICSVVVPNGTLPVEQVAENHLAGNILVGTL